MALQVEPRDESPCDNAGTPAYHPGCAPEPHLQPESSGDLAVGCHAIDGDAA